MVCNSCRQNIPDGSAVCPHCGAPVHPAQYAPPQYAPPPPPPPQYQQQYPPQYAQPYSKPIYTPTEKAHKIASILNLVYSSVAAVAAIVLFITGMAKSFRTSLYLYMTNYSSSGSGSLHFGPLLAHLIALGLMAAGLIVSCIFISKRKCIKLNTATALITSSVMLTLLIVLISTAFAFY